MTNSLDNYDQAILNAVALNGRITVTDLAAQINLSKSPTQARLKRLESAGYIMGYRAQLDPVKLGFAHIAFVEVKLTDTRETALQEFNAAVARVPEVEQCHMIAGSFDYLLKVRAADMQAYRSILGEKIACLPNVAHTNTHVVLEAVTENAF